MAITKIYVTVDKKDYAGLYWVSESHGKCRVHVSFADITHVSNPIDKQELGNAEQVAKDMLHALLKNMN